MKLRYCLSFLLLIALCRVPGGMVKPLSQDWGTAVRPHRAPSVVSLSKVLYPHCKFSTDFHQGKSGKRNTQEGLGSI